MLPETDLQTAVRWAKLADRIGWKASHGAAHATDPVEQRAGWEASGARDLQAIVDVTKSNHHLGTVLDWGAGSGRLIRHLAEQARWVFAADVWARDLFLLEDLFGNVSVVETDIPEMAAPAGSLDLVVSLHVLYSVTPEGVRETIRQLGTLLAPNGLLVADVPYRFGRGAYHQDPDPEGLPGGWWVHDAQTLMNGDLGGLWMANAPAPLEGGREPRWADLDRLSLWVWRKLT